MPKSPALRAALATSSDLTLLIALLRPPRWRPDWAWLSATPAPAPATPAPPAITGTLALLAARPIALPACFAPSSTACPAAFDLSSTAAIGPLDEFAFDAAFAFEPPAFEPPDERDRGFDFALRFDACFVSAISLFLLGLKGGSAPLAQLLLAAARPLLLQLRLGPSALGALLGNRRLRAALADPVAVVLDVVVLRLRLHPAELAAGAGAPHRGDEHSDDDQDSHHY